MADITPRDLNIFRILSSGPVVIETIRASLKKIPSKTHEPEQKQYNHDMSAKALSVRLSILKRDGLISAKRYRSRAGKGNHALYCLTPLSAEALVADGFNPAHIRYGLPNRMTVAHELEVTEVVRVIKKDAMTYQYEFDMEDENTLKSITKGNRKKVSYPDLFIRVMLVTLKGEEKKELAIEVDNDTIHPALVVEKVVRLHKEKGWRTAFLCTTPKRINRLIDAFASYIEERLKGAKDTAETENINKFKRMVVFSLQGDFSHKGLLDNKWVAIDGATGRMMPSGK